MKDSQVVLLWATASLVTVITWWITWFVYTLLQMNDAGYFVISMYSGPALGIFTAAIIPNYGKAILDYLKSRFKK